MKKSDELKKSVYPLKNGKWVAAVTFPREAKEKRVRKVFYGKTEKEARDKMYQFMFEYDNGDYIPKNKDLFISFLNDYYDISKHKWQQTTRELYRIYIDSHFEPYFKNMKLIDIKPITLDRFYNSKLSETKEVTIVKATSKKPAIKETRPRMTMNTVLKFNGFLKTAFEYAIKNEYVKKNPTLNVNLSKKEKYNPNILSEDDFKKLLSIVSDTDDVVPILLGAGCGLRRGEIFGLKWKDIDLDNGTIDINTTRVRVTKSLDKKPKNESSRRKFRAPDDVIMALKERKPLNALPADKVIQKWEPGTYTERFAALLESNNLPKVRFHDLRHFNAIMMLKNGVSDKVAATRLGHAQISTLRNVYQHVLSEMDELAADQITDVFKKPDKHV